MLTDIIKIIKWQSLKNKPDSLLPNSESDCVANESILTITVNNEELINFSCSSANLEEMAVGFLFSSGIISSINEIEMLKLCAASNKVSFLLKDNIFFDNKIWQKRQTITSGCGQGKSFNIQTLKNNIPKITGSLQVSPDYICELFSDLRNISQSYKNTGCIHIAALIKEGGPSIVREDIGRHNAIDKILGAALRIEVDFSKYILCCSGRISSDMILKAGRAGIPIVASRAAPTSLAVDIAEDLNITLIGFARGKRLNIYTHPKRILFNKQFDESKIQELAQQELITPNDTFL